SSSTSTARPSSSAFQFRASWCGAWRTATAWSPQFETSILCRKRRQKSFAAHAGRKPARAKTEDYRPPHRDRKSARLCFAKPVSHLNYQPCGCCHEEGPSDITASYHFCFLRGDRNSSHKSPRRRGRGSKVHRDAEERHAQGDVG